MVVGSPGAGRIIATVVELIVNAVDFGMDVTQTNDAPRFYCQKWDDYLHLEYGITQDVQDKLASYGHNIKYYAAPDLFFGGAQLILVDQKTGIYYGSADKRRGGAAIGY
jgi:gamma-glutamyltranspeptidase/glutathione hydrolase